MPLYPAAPSGNTPNSLCLTPDGKMLFVANADANNLAVFNVAEPRQGQAARLHPGRLVSDLGALQPGRQAALRRQRQGRPRRRPTRRAPTRRCRRTQDDRASTSPACIRGTLEHHRHARRRSSMATLQQAGVRVQPAAARPGRRRRRGRRTTRSRAKVGDASPIKHVIYIIKENRTYDQMLGDMKEGNGDPSLCLFPREGHAQPPQAGPRVRAAGQLLRATARCRPTGTSGRWAPTPPISSRRSGR